MKKYLPILTFLSLLFFSSCDSEDAPECFKTSGPIVEKVVEVEAFHEILVYDRINLFIEQGPEQKVVVESGKNIIDAVSLEVIDGRLILKNDDTCNLFRDYNLTNIIITVPNLTYLQNAGNTIIESVGELHFPKISLRSLNQEETKGVYTNGDFKLNLVSESVNIIGDDFSNFFLNGSTDNLKIFIAAGDGRVEAQDLLAKQVDFFHRGTNKVFVNPQEVLKGEVRSTGDVISVNRPPVVQVETYYTGKLIFR